LESGVLLFCLFRLVLGLGLQGQLQIDDPPQGSVVGGIGYFIGPIVGAIVLTLLETVLSNHTQIWQLYVGILFVLTVMYVPRGLTGLIMIHGPAYQAGGLRHLVWPYLKASLPLIAFLAGVIALLEMANRLNAAAVGATTVTWLGAEIDLAGPLPWLAAASLTVLGAYGLRCLAPEVRQAWEGDGRGP
jgi:branched-chain amino acid transport system permease protein